MLIFVDMKKILLLLTAFTLMLLPAQSQAQSKKKSAKKADVTASAKPASESLYYLTADQLPDLLKCLPAPPDSASFDFSRDRLRYLWGKRQRLNAERAAQACRDAYWKLDTLCAIFSEPFGLEISAEKTPAIYRVFTKSIVTMGQINMRAKAHYSRIRPFVYFDEPMLSRWEEDELRGEGSYPSGHTVRGWSAALLLSQINPEAATKLFLRGWQYGESRVIVGAHWQSDVDASRPVASMAFATLQSSAEFQKDLAETVKEFKKLTSGR